MHPVDIILYAYWVFDVALIILGLPHTLHWVKLPDVLREALVYGKVRGTAQAQTWLVKLIEVPKSWFTHFYVYGIVISIYMLSLAIGSYYLDSAVPGMEIVDSWVATVPQSIDRSAVTMICVMMVIQHTRRTYESIFVSVYSKGTMNIIHYLMGAFLYSTVQLCAFVEGPRLSAKGSSGLTLPQNPEQWLTILQQHWNKVLGFGLFIWASYEHHRAHVILANLRKDRSGQKILHRQHVIPRGGSFEYLSAPHFVAEILIYIAMGIVAYGSWTFWLGPALFTAINQSMMINETHNWYKSKFANYPKGRCRFVPFVF